MGNEFMFGRSILATPITEPQFTQEKIVREDAMTGWNRKETKSETSGAYIDWTATMTAEKYLPKGTDWYDFWTGKRWKGGQYITLQTALDRVPMFVRAGSILPLGPVMQYVGEKTWDSLEIRVYSGADGSFTLYEDEGDNYNYEKGIYATIPFQWNNKLRTLTIGQRKGNYPGMLQQRKFRIVIVNEAKGIGQDETSQYDATIAYDGSEQKVVLKE